MDIKFSEGNNPIYLLKIRWLGFDPDSDTWEPLISIYQDLPILVRKYIEDELLDESVKKHLLLVLEKADKKEYDHLKKNKTSRVRRINAIYNVEKVEKSNASGWFQEEKRILEQLVHKFGSGKYEDYENKSKQQLSTQLQRLMNLQSIGLFHGLRFKPAKAKEFLKNKFGIVEFHRNIPGRFNLAAERGFLLDLFQKEVVTEVLAEDININYFRRLDDPQHLQLILEEFEEPQCQQFLRAFGTQSKKDIENKLKLFSEPVKEVLRDSERIIFDFVKNIRSQVDIWTSLGRLYAKSQSHSTNTNYFNAEDENLIFESAGHILPLIGERDGKIELSFFEKQCATKYWFTYSGGNIFYISGTEVSIFIEPPDVTLYLCNVLDLTFLQPRAKHSCFDVVLLDPPWPVGDSNPTRGVTLDYPTMSFRAFSKLTLPVQNFPYGSVMFIWVTNSVYQDVLNWAAGQNYFLADFFTWVKIHTSGKLSKSLGFYFQHSQETCLMFERRSASSVVYSDIFLEKNSGEVSSSFLTAPTLPSVKPEEFYCIIEWLFPHANKLELFARHNNIRTTWTSCGLGLMPNAHVAYTSLSPSSLS
eukprot:snap_masked-scaffold_1-processed-gene-16.34-mRNA-1 protein AED:1.00 eAED:1.00 QI:0/0/0/0/1/1/2/0/586